jgi:hypothetical protein
VAVSLAVVALTLTAVVGSEAEEPSRSVPLLTVVVPV